MKTTLLRSGRYIKDKREPDFAYEQTKTFLAEKHITATLILYDGYGHIWIKADEPWHRVMIATFLAGLGLFVEFHEDILPHAYREVWYER
jgi:hypothetical protein